MTRTLYSLTSLCFATCLGVCLPGCDGIVVVKGWVMSGEESRSVFRASDVEAAKPKDVILQARVELWTGDGRTKLAESKSPRGDYEVTYIGPYRPGMKYLLKASAPGFAPLKQKVVLKKGYPVFGNIALVRLGAHSQPSPASQPDEKTTPENASGVRRQRQ